MLLNCGVGEDSWESLGLQGDPTSPFWRRSALGFLLGRNDAEAETPVLWPPHAKSWLIGKDWCWEGLEAGGEGDDRGWEGWMASLTLWSLSELRELVMDREAWRAVIHGVAKSRTRLRTELNWWNIFLYLDIEWIICCQLFLGWLFAMFLRDKKHLWNTEEKDKILSICVSEGSAFYWHSSPEVYHHSVRHCSL